MSSLIPLDRNDENGVSKRAGQYTIPKKFQDELLKSGEDFDPLDNRESNKTVAGKESDYQRQRYNVNLDNKSYKELMEEKVLEDEEKRVHALIQQKEKEKENDNDNENENENENGIGIGKDDKVETARKRRKRRWDVTEEDKLKEKMEAETKKSRWEEEARPKLNYPVINGIPLTNEILDKILPEGYEILRVPASYKPNEDVAPDFVDSLETENNLGYMIPQESTLGTEYLKANIQADVPKDLQFLKDHDVKYFASTLGAMTKEEKKGLSLDEQKKRRLIKLILRIKNGSPQIRKQAMRSLTDNSRYFGSKLLFDQILPLLKEPTLDDQERHLLVKVVDRAMYKLDDLVRSDTRRILNAITPLLTDEDYFSRVEAREIISNLSKAAGLSHMIATLRPDIDSSDEFIRNITARTFAIVANALGIQSLLPFLKAVCRSRKSWQARHTGIKIVQQIAILMGSGILPHLNGLVECISQGMEDEQLNVRTITAMALASLAEASAPYGIESFEGILEPLWNGIKRHRGKALATFLKAIGFIISLMDPEYASHYSKEVFQILIREFSSQDEEMKKTCLKVVQQCCSTEGISKSFLIDKILDDFFKNYWQRRVAMDKKINKILIETTYHLSIKCGVSIIVDRILIYLKDENEIFRRMTIETIDEIVLNLGSSDLSDRSAELLLDGIVFAYQQQSLGQDAVILHGFSTIVNSLGIRIKPHLQAIVSVILFRLKNKNPENRQQAADLISLIVPALRSCHEEDMVVRLSEILYESLGEVYPEVLGSILNALKSIILAVGIEDINPPIGQILPTLTPILRNRHEKVQENVIQLIGIIADKGSEYINAREWMRICFELLEMLKSPKKSIRKYANKTFGFIAKAIGPQDVLATLLNNLKVQERQLRVCTAVAIAIVAETCKPFTVIPALMNEYRTPDKNVQNGVLKSLSFMFEYLGDSTVEKEYIYSLVPLLEDALTDRDQVHRQTASSVVKHMALGCIGDGVEEIFIHFLNLILPNIFETSPHVIERILESIDCIRNNIGNGILMNYCLSGLFHPAKMVRQPYWKVYNSMYVQSCDSMVPYYPDFDDEIIQEDGHKKIEELDIWL
ncbi:hypothetical protein PACTADRAFT_51908 [Pachysolen tannophilus NRRL Y-2460]|uniref:Uncharacterized protein n=1 Tax=Pachysolen tannophilus NRRL Y-2460 TaxID=669874 RepID=A0A1E4TNJ8_PACTA|nr:hypothetical protein PACTADRAFT_51908 [Pachysolen tannophilus NRRL Y-2460]